MTAAMQFAGRFAAGEVQPLGAMLGPATFTPAAGRTVSPLAVAPWADDSGAEHHALPGVLKRLRGDWPCVPFGMTDAPAGLPADWQPAHAANVIDPFPHGFCSNHDWTLAADGTDGVVATIDYPANHPVRRLERHVKAAADAARIDIDLIVHPRESTVLPVGLHPTFRLPDAPGEAALSFAGRDVRAWTYPVPTEPGRSHLRANQRDVPINAVSTVQGGGCDLRSLPFAGDSEDVVLLSGTGGEATLSNHAEGYRVTLKWDATALPCCLLWISNHGRQFYPWNGRFRALGIEPVAAAFDLRLAFKDGRNPLNAAGIPTGVAFTAGQSWRTGYSISCAML